MDWKRQCVRVLRHHLDVIGSYFPYSLGIITTITFCSGRKGWGAPLAHLTPIPLLVLELFWNKKKKDQSSFLWPSTLILWHKGGNTWILECSKFGAYCCSLKSERLEFWKFLQLPVASGRMGTHPGLYKRVLKQFVWAFLDLPWA